MAQASVPGAGPGQDKGDRKRGLSLERRVEILTDEVQKLREQLVLPEKDSLKSVFGLGPAASKVYAIPSGLSVGGYGEMYLERKVKDKVDGRDSNTGDLLRYVQYLGYKFSDRLVLNAEIELEHAQAGEGTGGEIALEFAYLDYLAHPAVNVRFGLLLIPLGFINEIHEPPFFHGVLRPAVETSILPSTWRELGLGVFGEPLAGLSYKLYAVGGLNAKRFGPAGWRSGRQSGSKILSESWALAARIDYKGSDAFLFGAGLYYGGADHNQFRPELDVRTLLVEGHAQLRYRGLEARALAVYGTLSRARDLTLALFPDAEAGAAPETRLVASAIYGWYAEIAYDFWPLVSRRRLYLAPYFRYERLNTQHATPEILGRVHDAKLDTTILEAGLTFKPHPQVVVKLSYRDSFNEAGSRTADSVTLGAGFVY
jgi:hypothetical protein